MQVRAVFELLLRACSVPHAAILLFTLLVALGFGVWCMGILDAPTRFESVRRLRSADISSTRMQMKGCTHVAS